MLLADEVTRRDRNPPTPCQGRPSGSADAAAGLGRLRRSRFDHQLSELTSLRFLADGYNVLIMGPVGVGKTFLANALGHIAVRRQHSVHTERADKLFKRLRGARLDGSYEDEMRKLHRVEYASKWGRRGVLIIDDLALGLEEIAQLGRTLWRRRDDILAFFRLPRLQRAHRGHQRAARLEALRRNALGFRNLTHYRLRSLLHSGALHALINAV